MIVMPSCQFVLHQEFLSSQRVTKAQIIRFIWYVCLKYLLFVIFVRPQHAPRTSMKEKEDFFFSHSRTQNLERSPHVKKK